MLDQVLNIFNIKPDYDLDIMSKNQTLSNIASNILDNLPNIIIDFKPDLILVHGDTSTTFISALTAFYHNVDVGHVEAGLRTGNIYSPWPEEANRRLTSNITKLHFAPTKMARANLLKEGINKNNIYVTGNTVIDALIIAKKKILESKDYHIAFDKEYPFLSSKKQFILVTGHRRESFGNGFENICNALVDIAKKYPDILIIYPVHLNPRVREPVNRILKKISTIHLIEPLEYLKFIYFMEKSSIILTDSGGIQEEAPSLGKPVLVMRDTSERPEAIEAGTAILVGSDRDKILKQVSKILDNKSSISRDINNPYGRGDSAQQIASIITSS
jgi:UDP-N-acetylglucosamine 2-epimerase (non-hydrolysing)